eukprot:UC4_evm1s1279
MSSSSPPHSAYSPKKKRDYFLTRNIRSMMEALLASMAKETPQNHIDSMITFFMDYRLPQNSKGGDHESYGIEAPRIDTPHVAARIRESTGNEKLATEVPTATVSRQYLMLNHIPELIQCLTAGLAFHLPDDHLQFLCDGVAHIEALYGIEKACPLSFLVENPPPRGLCNSRKSAASSSLKILDMSKLDLGDSKAESDDDESIKEAFGQARQTNINLFAQDGATTLGDENEDEKLMPKSMVELVLEDEFSTLGDKVRGVLCSPDVLDELTFQNEKVINFFCQHGVFRELLSLVTSEEPELRQCDTMSDGNQESIVINCSEFALAALLAGAEAILDRLAEDSSLDVLFAVTADRNRKLNPKTASYWSHILISLLNLRSESMANYIQRNPELLDDWISHLYCIRVCEWLEVMSKSVEKANGDDTLQEWIVKQGLATKLLEKLSQETFTDYDNVLELFSNTCKTHVMEECELQEYASPNPFAEQIL